MKRIVAIATLLFLFLALAAYPTPQPPMPDQYGFVNPLPHPERDYRTSSIYRHSWQDNWVPASRDLYTYHPTNPQIEVISSSMYDEEWVYNTKSDSHLDAQGLNFLTRIFSWQDEAWLEHSCTVTEYNDAGQITASRVYDWWHSETEHSELTAYSVYTYQDGMLSNLSMEFYEDSEVSMYSTFNYTYNEQGLLCQEDVSSNLYLLDTTDIFRNLYYYNSQNLLQETLGYKLVNNTWLAYHRTQYTYDEFGRVSVLLFQISQYDGQNLENYSRIYYSYNAQGLKSEEIFQAYRNSNWTNYYKDIFSYEYVAGDDPIQSPVQLSFGPNPFTDHIKLWFNLPKSQNTQLKIFDIRGRLMYSKDLGILNAGNHEILCDLKTGGREKLPSGIYLIRLKTGNQLIHRKALMIK